MTGSIMARRRKTALLVGCGLLLPASAAVAGNGLNDVAYGAESAGMASADLAVTHDPSALNINPAGLTQVGNREFNADFEPFYYIDNRHRDEFGNDKKVSGPFNAVISGGYVQRIPGTGVVAGIGLFAQGGAGVTYKGLNTAFGTVDDISSTFGSFKIEPGFGWQATENLSLGASLGIVYSQAREKFFPDTSYAAPDGGTSFYGFRLDGLAGWSTNGKLGFQYRLGHGWVIGGDYTSKAPIKLTGGNATFDYDAAGQGRVVYANASLTGLNIAQEAGLGIAFRPNASWIVSAEVNWVDWSGALKNSTLRVSDPNNPNVPQKLDLTSALDWRDQAVIAVGAAYDWDERTTLRFGYNYGRNPVPAQTTSPVLALLANRTIAAGISRRVGQQWDCAASAYYQPRVAVTYTNPQLPFGANAYEHWDAVIVQLMVSRRW